MACFTVIRDQLAAVFDGLFLENARHHRQAYRLAAGVCRYGNLDASEKLPAAEFSSGSTATIDVPHPALRANLSWRAGGRGHIRHNSRDASLAPSAIDLNFAQAISL